MTTSGSYNASQVQPDLDSEIHRLQTQVLISWHKEARTLNWFGLRDGMSVLELGSGPGFFTQQLLNWLPNSTITAVEIDPILIERAKQHLSGQAGERLHLVEASVMNTGLPDNHFDFAIARLLFQHLPDPTGAAREILRVLKPGGKLVVIDVDGHLRWVIEPSVPELELVMEKVYQSQVKRGGNPFIGRQLWRILQSVGFKNLDLEAVVFHSDESGIEAFLPQFNPDILLNLVKAGVLSEQEQQRVAASFQTSLNSANPLIVRLWLMACGEKPQ